MASIISVKPLGQSGWSVRRTTVRDGRTGKCSPPIGASTTHRCRSSLVVRTALTTSPQWQLTIQYASWCYTAWCIAYSPGQFTSSY